MKTSIPPQAKRYLLEALSTYENPTGVGSGGGGGAPRGKKGEATGVPSAGEILFGNTEKGDWGAGAATGFYMGGKAAEAAASTLEKFGPQMFGKMMGAGKWFPKGNSLLGDIGQSLAGGFLSAVPGAAAKVARQLGDISGANWFDANIGHIGQSAMRLAAEGGGRPWTPFVIPGQRTTRTAQYDPDYDLRKQVEKASKQREYDRLRRLGYINP